MRVILLTPPATAATELATVNQLFRAGLRVLHVRKPNADAATLAAYLRQVDPAYRRRLVLHQHHELAADLGLKGVHFKERHRPPPPLPPPTQPGLTQSTSLHRLEDVLADWQHLDYAFLSPVFDSISKAGYAAAGFDEAALADALRRAQMPVYALGGITPERLPAVQRMGFAGVGVLGAVWESSDPVAAMRQFGGCPE